MGMFDTVRVPCPACGGVNDFQSKGGECDLQVFDISSVPLDVLGGLFGAKQDCVSCQASIQIGADSLDEAHIDGSRFVFDPEDIESDIE